MAKRSKSDLVGNLINKRKMMGQSITDTLPDDESAMPKADPKTETQPQEKIKNIDKSSTAVKKEPAKKKTNATKKKTLGEVGSILSELKEGKKQDRYASIKIKSELYNRIKKIARKEGIDRHGHLIDKVLTDFCDRYEEK